MSSVNLYATKPRSRPDLALAAGSHRMAATLTFRSRDPTCGNETIAAQPVDQGPIAIPAQGNSYFSIGI